MWCTLHDRNVIIFCDSSFDFYRRTECKRKTDRLTRICNATVFPASIVIIYFAPFKNMLFAVGALKLWQYFLYHSCLSNDNNISTSMRSARWCFSEISNWVLTPRTRTYWATRQLYNIILYVERVQLCFFYVFNSTTIYIYLISLQIIITSMIKISFDNFWIFFKFT